MGQCVGILRNRNIGKKIWRDINKKCCQPTNSLYKRATKFLQTVLDANKELFDRKLGLYPHKKFRLELKEGAKPCHKWAYLIPFQYEGVFKDKLDKLICNTVLEKCRGFAHFHSPQERWQSQPKQWLSRTEQSSQIKKYFHSLGSRIS